MEQKLVLVIGAMQTITGIVSMILGVVTLFKATSNPITYVSAPIWMGLLVSCFASWCVFVDIISPIQSTYVIYVIHSHSWYSISSAIGIMHLLLSSLLVLSVNDMLCTSASEKCCCFVFATSSTDSTDSHNVLYS